MTILVTAKASPTLIKKALNFISNKYRVRKKFLKFIGVMDASPLKKEFYLFNILDPRHPNYRSTKAFEVSVANIVAAVVDRVANVPPVLRTLKMDKQLLDMSLQLALAKGDHVVKVLKEIIRDRYIIRRQRIQPIPNEEPVTVEIAYTFNGNYVGEEDLAKYLFDEMGLEKVQPSDNSNVCNIGFNAKNKKWYGWSHRAIHGFGIGDKIFEEDFGTDTTDYSEHGKRTIKTLEEAKISATKFAEHVS